MNFPVSTEELRRRHAAYEKSKGYVFAIACTPLLMLYLLIHTKYLRPYIPESKSADVFVLIVLPSAWFAVAMGLHHWLGPLRHRLRCPGCARRLVGKPMEFAADEGRCDRCGAPLTTGPAASESR
jgi:hypothetical protein